MTLSPRLLPAVLAGCSLSALAGTPGAQCELMTLTASDGAPDDELAAALSISGATSVLGAPGDDDFGSASGSAYVFAWTSEGAWGEGQKLNASDAVAGAAFGRAVALSGTLALVGAPFAPGFGVSEGAAYVFEQTQFGGWLETAKLTAPDGAFNDEFGRAVAAAGPLIVIGAPASDGAGLSSGSVYVFEAGPGGRTVSKLVAANAATGDEFGAAVAVSPGRVAVGAPFDQDGGVNSGAVYMYEQDVFGTWVQVAKLTTSDQSSGDRFGHAVALDGDRLLASAYLEDAAAVNGGAAYVFERLGGVWTETARLTASDAQDFDQLGGSAALSGDRAVLGAVGDDDQGGLAGAAYVFERVGAVWSEKPKLLASDGAALDQLASAVAISGGRVLVASDIDHAQGSPDGSAYVFELASDAALWGCPHAVSAGAGGTQALEIDAGAGLGLQLYWVLGTTSGTSPGFASGSFLVPLNFDSYMVYRFMSPNLPPITSGLSLLGANGTASTAFTLPPGMPPSLIGTTFHHAYAVFDAVSFQTYFVSNPVPVQIVP